MYMLHAGQYAGALEQPELGARSSLANHVGMQCMNDKQGVHSVGALAHGSGAWLLLFAASAARWAFTWATIFPTSAFLAAAVVCVEGGVPLGTCATAGCSSLRGGWLTLTPRRATPMVRNGVMDAKGQQRDEGGERTRGRISSQIWYQDRKA